MLFEFSFIIIKHTQSHEETNKLISSGENITLEIPSVGGCDSSRDIFTIITLPPKFPWY